MSRCKIFRKWSWYIVGAAAVAMALAVPTYFKWTHQKQNPSVKQRIDFTSSPKDTAPSISITAPAPAPATSRAEEIKVKPANPFDTLRRLAIDDPDPGVRLGGIEAALSQSDTDCFNLLYEASQRDFDPDNRLSTLSELEHVIRSGLGDKWQLIRLLEKSAADTDPRVAHLAKLILQEQLGVELLEGSEMWTSDEYSQQETTADGTRESADIMENSEASFEDIQQQALYDSDPSVRLCGIEAALSQEKEKSYWLLADAALNDYDPDNRLSAVSTLEQMLKSGLGNGAQILQLLENTSSDPDPRVAELSSLIIQELLEAQEKPLQHQEQEIEEKTNANNSAELDVELNFMKS